MAVAGERWRDGEIAVTMNEHRNVPDEDSSSMIDVRPPSKEPP